MRALLTSLLLASAGALAAPAAFRDPLDLPAQPSALAAHSPLSALARAGTRLVAAGARGHVLVSADEGRSWTQARVPVSSDLLALSFPDALHGWAVGHDGVILATADGGDSWVRQFDGRALGARGAENPLLDVWFTDAEQGWAVGAFGQMLATEDGGRTWRPVPAERSDNPKGLHLYAVRGVAGRVYAVGEQGLLLRLNRVNGRFEALSQPYAGTLFGIAGDEGLLLIHGLRGHVLRSTDGGQSWAEVPTGLQVGLTAVARAGDGSWMLASQAGHLLVSRDAGRSFTSVRLADKLPPAAAIADASPHDLVVAGPRGVQALRLP